MKNRKIAILVLFFCMNFIFAQNNFSVDNESFINQCPDGCVPSNSEGEKIDCSNFYWVENYIKNEIENYSSQGVQLIDVLKTANYNLQDEINRLESKSKKLFYISLLISLLFILYIVFIQRILKEIN